MEKTVGELDLGGESPAHSRVQVAQQSRCVMLCRQEPRRGALCLHGTGQGQACLHCFEVR
jgi:hypothetical protein